MWPFTGLAKTKNPEATRCGEKRKRVGENED